MSAPDQVSELLVRWENLLKHGQSISAEELCAECPGQVEELKRRMQVLKSMDQMLVGGPVTDRSQPPTEADAQAEVWERPTIPGYEILRLVDRGGMGEVFLARDDGLHREVAIKRVRPGSIHDAETRRRFLLEAEITGRLEHPGVVSVHALLHDKDGRPCYAMRFIEGETLHDAIKRFYGGDKAHAEPTRRNVAFRQLLSRFIDVCNAVAYAHSRSILHRDLKPSNIVLGKYGETIVLDWGLARSFEKGAAARASGTEASARPSANDSPSRQPEPVVGTLAYMSPEQAAGRSDLVGTASDIYSLGATLYALLTGQAPFQGRQASAQAAREQFPPPGRVKKHLSRGLEAICLKAMATLPENRYATALELSGDVEHWLADEPITAWKAPLLTKARRWAKRHRVLLGSAAAGLVVALVAITVNLVKVNAARDLAEHHRQQAETALQLALGAADDFTHTSEDVLLDFPDLQPKRKQMLEKALEYYEDLLAPNAVSCSACELGISKDLART